MNPYDPPTDLDSPVAVWRRTWRGFPLISYAITLTGFAFFVFGAYFTKILWVDVDPAYRNRTAGITVPLVFTATASLQFLSAWLYYRESTRLALVALVSSPLLLIGIAVAVRLFVM